jgi:hypothetical protein
MQEKLLSTMAVTDLVEERQLRQQTKRDNVGKHEGGNTDKTDKSCSGNSIREVMASGLR